LPVESTSAPQLVRQRHQQQSASTRLNVLFGNVFGHPGKHGRKRLARGVVDVVDRQQFEANFEVLASSRASSIDLGDEYGPGMPTPITFFRAERIGRDRRGQRGIDASAESDDRPLEAAFVNVISRAQNQRFVGAGFFTRNLRMHVSGECLESK
jgi:hypothetical protein